MGAAILLTLAAVAGGTLVSYAYDDDAPVIVRIAYGTATGLVALSAVGFVLAHVVGTATAGLVAGIVVALPLGALVRPAVRSRVVMDGRSLSRELIGAVRRPTLSPLGPIAYSVALTALLWLVFDRVVIEQDGGLATGYVNNLGDMPFHIGVISSFAFGQNFPPEDPTFAGTGFVYPYLSDVMAALFVALGSSFRDAILVGNLALGLALVAVIHRFTRVITGDRLAAYLAPLLVLFSGGLGWALLLRDAAVSEAGVIELLGAMPRDYTITPEGPLRWGNAITTLLVTQRGLLMGLPIALLALTLLWKLIHLEEAPKTPVGHRTVAIAAGILTGSLPLVHAHSFIVVMGTAFLLGLLFRQWRQGCWRPWLLYVTAALALALPQMWWSTRDSVASAGTFFGWELGWDRGQENVVWFWLMNTGLFIPLAAVASIWLLRERTGSRSLLLFTAAFIVWFVVPNLVKLAPWVWDNIKVLIYWFIGFVPLVAWLIAQLLKADTVRRGAGVAAVVVLTLAGGLDVWRAVSGQTIYGEFDRDSMTLAARIREATPPRALLLNAPIWNATVFLTGRPTLLGYTGHAFSRGLPYAERESAIARIYAGEPDAGELIDRYAIEYIVVSPIERNNLTVNDAFLDQFPRVAEAGEYVLHEVPRP